VNWEVARRFSLSMGKHVLLIGAVLLMCIFALGFFSGKAYDNRLITYETVNNIGDFSFAMIHLASTLVGAGVTLLAFGILTKAFGQFIIDIKNEVEEERKKAR
ncbi:MAG: hypothetical protein WC050_01240, partial [Candidatus Paceibacterota bacterium]